MRAFILITMFFLYWCAPAVAKEITITLNDDEQAALRNILDVATHAQGMMIAPATVYINNKLSIAASPPPPKPAEEPAK